MRTLSLRKEVLTELSTDDLRSVVGGAITTIVCFTQDCITTPYSGLDCTSDQICH